MSAPPGEPDAPAARPPERLLVALLAIAAVAGPYLLRALDDNRLTSWRWVFGASHPAILLALAAGAAGLALLLARVRVPRGREALLFLCAYGAGAAFWSEPEPLVDAARYFTQAKHLELYGAGWFLREWGREIPAWTDLPLVPFLFGIVLRVSGESRLAIEAFTTLLFAGTAVLTARIGRALWDEETGLAAGVLLLASPYLLAQVPAMLVDVPTAFFFALALQASIAALLDGGAPRALLAGGAVFLALFSKGSAALLLSAVPVAAIALRGAAPRPLRTLGTIAAVAAVLAAAAVLPSREVYARQLALLLSYQAPGLGRWGESFLSTFLFQVHPFVAAAAIASAWVALRRRDARWIVAAWPVLLLVALGVRRSRYLLPAFPMLALAAAYGLRILRATETRRAVAACAAVSSLAVGTWGYLPFLRSTSAANLRSAGAHLDGLDVDRVEVLTASAPAPEVNPAVSVPILDLFTAKRIEYRDEGYPRPSGERAATSPLRFTWELGVPRYYAPEPSGRRTAIVVVSDGVEPLPARVSDRLAGYALARSFDADEGVFRHRTRVEVFLPGASVRP